MNAKKGFEYLEKLKQNDTSAQLYQFLNKKYSFTTTTYKSRYMKYLEYVMPILYHQEECLKYHLQIDKMYLKQKPSLQGFFALMAEEYQLSIELSELYANTHDNSVYRLLEDCASYPKRIMNINRVFNAKEYHLLENMFDTVQDEAKQLLNHINTLKKAEVSISTSTFQYFDQFDVNVQPVKSIHDNMLLEVVNMCLLHENKIKEKPTDIYAEAFKIPKPTLDHWLTQLKGKIRSNIQTKVLVQTIYHHLIQIGQLIENPIDDDQFECYILEADDLQAYLDSMQQNYLKTTTKHFPQQQNTQLVTKYIYLNQAEYNAVLTKYQEAQIKAKVQKQVQQEIKTKTYNLEIYVYNANQQAQYVIRKQIVNIKDQKAANKQAEIRNYYYILDNERLSRIKAAERDAERVRPQPKHDPERLYRETQVISNRKAHTTMRLEYMQMLGRGYYDMRINGENLVGTTNIGFNKALSFDIMSNLADKGLLGTDAARDALYVVQYYEHNQRFHQWALRDDVRKLW